MTEQWQELKETIIELRDNDGTGTQKEVCKFLANLMDVLEKQMREPKTGHWIDDNDGFGTKCSKCGKWYSHSYLTRQEVIYCCRCGAKMVESEDKYGGTT